MSFDLVKLVILALQLSACSFRLAGGRDESRTFRDVYQPVDVGFQFATPLNLANTLQNSVAGPISIALIVAFAGILVAGLVASKSSQPDFTTARSNDNSNFVSRLIESLENLDADEAFRYMGEQRDGCNRKVICHIHQSLARAPDWIQMIFRFFSRNIRGVSKYKDDIVEGLAGGDCQEKYRFECPLSIGQIFMRTPLMRHILNQQNRHYQTANEHYFRFA